MQTTKTQTPQTQKTLAEKVWENVQLAVLAATILGQCVIGEWYLIGQGLWLAANVVSLIRDFALTRPLADKIKDAALTAITVGLIIIYITG